MKVLFLTQSKSLRVFHDVAQRIGTAEGQAHGFYIAGSTYYREFIRANPSFHAAHPHTLTEWSILAKARGMQPDLAFLREKERAFGDGTLWHSLVADRRLFFGPAGAYREDYATRYTHAELLAIVETGIRELEALFDRLQPDCVVTFICVTLGQYLAWLIARQRGIPFIDLRPTRIRNYFYGAESVHEPSARLQKRYETLLATGLPAELVAQVTDYLDFTRKQHGMYEGVLPAGNTAAMPLSAGERPPSFAARLRAAVRRHCERRRGPYRYDNDDPGLLATTCFKYFGLPRRKRRIATRFKRTYVREADLPALNYVFFPLHKEPEVTLLVYSRPWLDQLDVVRRLARSLPLGMTLLVKEHPAGLGYHPVAYYEQIAAIPNVRLVDPAVGSRALIAHARLVTVICGSIGLEALVLKKPVLALGRTPYEFLPRTMVRRNVDPHALAQDLADMLERPAHNETALRAYLAAVIAGSVPVDFYTRLLGRGQVYQPASDRSPAEERNAHLDRLARYIEQQAAGAGKANPP